MKTHRKHRFLRAKETAAEIEGSHSVGRGVIRRCCWSYNGIRHITIGRIEYLKTVGVTLVVVVGAVLVVVAKVDINALHLHDVHEGSPPEHGARPHHRLHQAQQEYEPPVPEGDLAKVLRLTTHTHHDCLGYVWLLDGPGGGR
ncbi:hypothetical protein Pcinc_037521 [Petrolisthes cinctipes]|uniref:Uncharacterized protein n=1 Tax=Petrolisthes cinctipes TaxID=88211 RepID=A0AAE1EKX1_PETCI|nr:hypothetical protein Pcinc_037521 [Petrolisthes cinctipes]